ncbi:hypothetical protein COLO4_08426 [Corchorus olitorius]|uniref:Uncharacterized protein n=1 Tax=Corchorus olitorius TaxID=93759 RepID=A0A1R3KG07_9ROSI|nr:hypothetical protein COLO4_08426 [Corchorus olitorius]
MPKLKRGLEIAIPAPFPSKHVKRKKGMIEDKQLRELCKLEELCTTKRTLKVDIIDYLTEQIAELEKEDSYEVVLQNSLQKKDIKDLEFTLSDNLEDSISDLELPSKGNLFSVSYISLEPTPKPLPSIE